MLPGTRPLWGRAANDLVSVGSKKKGIPKLSQIPFIWLALAACSFDIKLLINAFSQISEPESEKSETTTLKGKLFNQS